jgi:hypothetical protein
MDRRPVSGFREYYWDIDVAFAKNRNSVPTYLHTYRKSARPKHRHPATATSTYWLALQGEFETKSNAIKKLKLK